ncbi:MAG: hypothetical protein AB7L71_10650 [Vicinamibacterales bacterium]
MTPVTAAHHLPTWRWLPVVTLAALALRLWWAVTTLNIHHPDEVYQYLEQAHRWVFGYGFIPWEFRFGTRSWLLPFLISAPLAALKSLGWDAPAVYVPTVQSLVALCATALVPIGYHLTRRLATEDAARLTAVFIAGWYELLYFSVRPLPDSIAVVVVPLMIAGALSRRVTGAVATGLSAGLLVVLRVHLLPVTLIAAVLAHRQWTRRQWTAGAIAWAVTLAGLGALDAWMWGSWFASVHNNVLMNFVRGVSQMFGVQHPLWFLGTLAVTSAGLWLLIPLASLSFIRSTVLPIVVVVTIVGTLSLNPHKEYRFILPAVPFLLMLAAICATTVSRRLSSQARRFTRGAIVAGMAVMSWAGGTGRLPYEWHVYEAPLAEDDVLRAMRFLSAERDLTALYVVDEEWGLLGGYYHLHRDVPVYFGGDLDRRAEPGIGPDAYVSHVLDWTETPTPGFTTIARFGVVEVRHNVTANTLRPLETSRHLPQPGIDDVYVPTVRPRLPN